MRGCSCSKRSGAVTRRPAPRPVIRLGDGIFSLFDAMLTGVVGSGGLSDVGWEVVPRLNYERYERRTPINVTS